MTKEREKESKRMEKEMKKVEMLTFMQKIPELAKNTRDWPVIQGMIKRAKQWMQEQKDEEKVKALLPPSPQQPLQPHRRASVATVTGVQGSMGAAEAVKAPTLQKARPAHSCLLLRRLALRCNMIIQVNLAIQFASLGRSQIDPAVLGVLRCTPLHCAALRCTALHCCAALHCTALRCAALCCTAHRCAALRCTWTALRCAALGLCHSTAQSNPVGLFYLRAVLTAVVLVPSVVQSRGGTFTSHYGRVMVAPLRSLGMFLLYCLPSD